MYDKIRAVIEEMEAAKPNDRSPRDRAFQVALTDLEKVAAYIAVAIDGWEPPNGQHAE